MSDMTDEQFIGYCELHCTTERALFSGKQINRILELAGHPPEYVRAVANDEWIQLHTTMADLCRIARNRGSAERQPEALSSDEPPDMTPPALPQAAEQAEPVARDEDGEPYTPERLAAWLDAKYSRHKEYEDKAAADLIRRLAPQVNQAVPGDADSVDLAQRSDSTPAASAEPSKPKRVRIEDCTKCGGSGVVDDGELTHYEGTSIPYENGPIKCVKDCPVCGGKPW